MSTNSERLRHLRACSADKLADALLVSEGKIAALRKLLLTGLAIHGAVAFTDSEKEWREEARAALDIKP